MVVNSDSHKTKVEQQVGRKLSQLLTAGTSACIADIVTFPLDTAKVRLQVQGEGGSGGRKTGVLRTLGNVVRSEGVSALYRGIVPGLQRQMAFSAIRIGLYEDVKQWYTANMGVSNPHGLEMLGVRTLAGVTTATMAILAAQPTDVVKIRMQAGARTGQYRGVLHAYTSIASREGVVKGLYRGTVANIARNAIVNVGETVVYDASKDALISQGYMLEGVPCHLVSALIAGVSATVVASPVDVIKTRFMNAGPGVYSSALECARLTVRREGLPALYRGFTASCSRLVSWNIVLWVSFEQIKLAVAGYQQNRN